MIVSYSNNTLSRVVYACKLCFPDANFDFLQADQVFTSPENYTTHVEETHGRGNEEEKKTLVAADLHLEEEEEEEEANDGINELIVIAGKIEICKNI